MFRYDDELDFMYNVKGKRDLCTFSVNLYKMPEYKEFAKICIMLFTFSPDTVEVERGFRSLNYIKNQFRNWLSEQNANAAMSLSMQKTSVMDFPFEKFLK